MMRRLGLFVVVAVVSTACLGHDEVDVAYVNESGVHATVFVQGLELAEIDPGEATTFGVRLGYLPYHIEAFDDAGNRIFSVTVDLDDLKATGFRVIIRKSAQQ